MIEGNLIINNFNQPKKTNFISALNSSYFNLKDFQFISSFYPQIRSIDTLDLKGSFNLVMEGNDEEISFKRCSINTNYFKYLGELALSNKNNYNLKIDNAQVYSAKIKPLLPLITPNLQAEYQNILDEIDTLNFNGIMGISKEYKDIVLAVLFKDKGSVKLDIHHETVKHKNEFINGSIEVSNFDLSPFMKDSKLGKIKGVFKFSGNRKDKDSSIESAINSSVDYVYYDNFLIQNIEFDLEKKSNLIKGKGQVNNKFIDILFSGNVNIKNKTNLWDVNANIKKLNLEKLGIKEGTVLKTKLFLVAKTGDDINDIEANINLKNINYLSKKDGNFYSYGDLLFETNLSNNIRTIQLNAPKIAEGKITGKYNLIDLYPLLQNGVSTHYDFIQPKKLQNKNQNFKYDLTINGVFFENFSSNIYISKNSFLKGELNYTNNYQFIAKLNTPKLKIKNQKFTNLDIDITPFNEVYNSKITVDTIDVNEVKLSKFNLTSRQKEDTLYVKTSFDESKLYKNIKLNFYQTKTTNKEIVFGLNNSQFIYQDNQWKINPTNDFKHTLIYDTRTIYSENPIIIRNKNKLISLNGRFNNEDNFNIDVSTKDIYLKDLLTFKKGLILEGKINGDFNLNKLGPKKNINLNLNVDSFVFNDILMGDVSIKSIANNIRSNSYPIEVDLVKDQENIVNGKGNITLTKPFPVIDIDAKANDFNLGFISNMILNKEVTDISGLASGDINISGSIDDINFEGDAVLREGGLRINYTNTHYSFEENASVKLTNKSFIFPKLKVRDKLYETEGELFGSLTYYKTFVDWDFDLTVETKRLLGLNTKPKLNSLYYGTAFLDGSATLKGSLNNLFLNVEGTSQEGTFIKILLRDSQNKLVDTSFINFIDKNSTTTSTPKINSKSDGGISVRCDFNVNRNAKLEIVTNLSTNSNFSGIGNGNILIETSDIYRIGLWGDFIISEGLYDFNRLGINKKFKISPNSTISWRGDPYDANMNIQAIYDVPGGANPIVLLDDPTFNKKLPTQVKTSLRGNIFKPENPIFEITFPNLDKNIAEGIRYRLLDQEQMQLQAISLLSQGFFINDVSLSLEGLLLNTLSQTATSKLFDSFISNGDDEKMQLELNVSLDDNSLVETVLNNELDNRVGLNLTTEISDKILINGNFGVPTTSVDDNAIIFGNVQIDFILNDKRTLKAKVFNRENELRVLENEIGYTQGVGLSYQLNFNKINLSNKTEKE